MQLYLYTDKQGVEKLIQWKEKIISLSSHKQITNNEKN
jgi:hypothetical protein